MNIIQPTFVIYKQKCLENIRKMAKKAKQNTLIFRPHFKTHQLAEIGEWFSAEGVDRITVSSVEMAEYFAEHGWKEITIAFPLNIREMDKINELTCNINLNLLVDSLKAAHALRDNTCDRFGYFIEVDTGYHRTGIDVHNKTLIDNILAKLAENELATFKGFLIHSGNTYHARTIEEVLKIHQNTLNELNCLKDHYAKYFKELMISIGDTPSCSLSDNFHGVDEIRPGNFVYYDWMQYKLGSCDLKDIAVTMVCPVVGKYPDRKEIAIHGGAVHFSKDYVLNEDGKKIFGQAITKRTPLMEKMLSFEVDEQCYLKSLSQEHGIMHCSDEFFNKTEIGDLVSVIPIHSCLTMNLMKNKYLII